MGTYNVLQASLICPRCGAEVETEIDCHFGYTSDMVNLAMGDRYPFQSSSARQSNAQPDGHNIDGEGYMECPRCHKDAFLIVNVRDGIITMVHPDPHRGGYISDEG